MEENILRQKLSGCKTMAEMLKVLTDRYDLNDNLGLIQKPMMVQGLIKAHQILKPKLK